MPRRWLEMSRATIAVTRSWRAASESNTADPDLESRPIPDGDARTTSATERTRTSTNELRKLVLHPWNGGVNSEPDSNRRHPGNDNHQHTARNRARAATETRLLGARCSTTELSLFVPPRGFEPLPTTFAESCPFRGTVAHESRWRESNPTFVRAKRPDLPRSYCGESSPHPRHRGDVESVAEGLTRSGTNPADAGHGSSHWPPSLLAGRARLRRGTTARRSRWSRTIARADMSRGGALHGLRSQGERSGKSSDLGDIPLVDNRGRTARWDPRRDSHPCDRFERPVY